jgi:penicillin-binding protein 2
LEVAIRRLASGPVGGGCATILLLAVVVGIVYVSGLGSSVLAQFQTASPSPTAPSSATTGTAGAASPSAKATTSAAPQATPAPPTSPTPAPPPPDGIAREYLAAWQERRFADMYALLAPSAQVTIDQTKFVNRYLAITDAATVTEIATTMGQPQLGPLPNTARVPFQLTLKTVRLGAISEQNTMPLGYENGRWGVRWTPSLIFKDLQGDNLIRMLPLNPQRGSILDRQGKPLAIQGFVLTVGVVPGQIQNEADLLKALADVTKMSTDDIKKKYAGAQPDWFVPIKDLPASDEEAARQKLEPIPGVMLQNKSVRTYPQGEVGANVVGYVSKVTAEDLRKLAGQGYDAEDYIGRSGIEAWADADLAGQRGGKLAIVSPTGEVLRVIAEQPAKRGNDVYLTLDIDIQKKAEQSIGTDKPGSIVVMDPGDNAILALATYPRFDPNKFVTGMTDEEWTKLSTDPRYPMLNRPATASYATGSIFKIIPFTAAIERLGYGPYQMTPCPGSYTIPNSSVVLHDLLPQGHGILPFPETLTQSCNVPFYDIGYKLNQSDPSFLPQWTRLWGLGQLPGTVGLAETAGIVPDDAWKRSVVGQPWYPGDAVLMAIGQGYFQASPLQMANAYSTLANRGVLRTPLLVRKVASVEGQVVRAYAAEERGRVPLRDVTLEAIYSGLKKTGTDPHGTAYYAFSTFKTPLVAKTGSAENEDPTAHAWFAGWAPADTPQYLVVVMIEGGRAGGTVAAPKARALMDYFFPGSPPIGNPPASQPVATPTPTVRAIPIQPTKTRTPVKTATRTPTRTPTPTPTKVPPGP